MPTNSYGLGDMVWSSCALRNDGTVPGLAEDAELAPAGARGVIVKVGHLEQEPEVSIYIVRFEDAAGVLGPPVGCTGDDLTQDQALVASLQSGAPSAPADPSV
jgi:nitrogen fixation protein NifZ